MNWTWALVVLSLAGNVQVIRKKRSGFGLWIASNVGWGLAAAHAQNWPQATLWSVYLGMSIWGFLRWTYSGANCGCGAYHQHRKKA